MKPTEVVVNGTAYRWPPKPTVVVCIDGGDPEYLQWLSAKGLIPNIARFIEQGFSTVAQGAMPSFTCPNNMSIVTGTPVSQHGISGNFYLDTQTGKPVVMTGPELLRNDTILSQFAHAGAKVISITAKDKLRRQLSKNLEVSQGNISFSAEQASHCTLQENGIENVLARLALPQPEVYSAALSLFVLEAGLQLLEKEKPDLMYLSLTDWVQHKYAPEEKEAQDFYQALDHLFGQFDQKGALLALTADHGMSDKSNADGQPNVIWLQDVLDQKLGAGAAQVICPITDAYVGHHGALGGFVRVWCQGQTTPQQVIESVTSLDGIELVLDKENVCIGSSADQHDFSGLQGHRLRTHGSTSEAQVPLIFNHPLNTTYKIKAGVSTLKSHQLFDYLLNGVDLIEAEERKKPTD